VGLKCVRFLCRFASATFINPYYLRNRDIMGVFYTFSDVYSSEESDDVSFSVLKFSCYSPILDWYLIIGEVRVHEKKRTKTPTTFLSR
jgi:hypothetical protein